MIGPESISVPSRSNRTTDLRIAAIVAARRRLRLLRPAVLHALEIEAPWRGRRSAARTGGRPSSSAANASGSRLEHRPHERPHHVPQERVAVTVKWSSSPRTLPSGGADPRRNTSCWVSVGVKAVKSCSPGSRAAQRLERVVVDGPWPPERRARGGRARSRRRARRTGRSAPSRRSARGTAPAPPPRATTATSSGSAVLSASGSRATGGAARRRRGSRPGPSHERRHRSDRRRRGRSSPGSTRRGPRAGRPRRSARPAAAPTPEARPVVLERQPKRSHGRCLHASRAAARRRARDRREL